MKEFENNSTDFWLGVLSGALATFILTIVFLFTLNERIKELQGEMDSLKNEHEIQKEWIEENKTIMRTYKFFNESWKVIIELQEKN